MLSLQRDRKTRKASLWSGDTNSPPDANVDVVTEAAEAAEAARSPDEAGSVFSSSEPPSASAAFAAISSFLICILVKTLETSCLRAAFAVVLLGRLPVLR